MERLNAPALAALVDRHGVKLAAFPADLVSAARGQADSVLGDLAARDAATAKVHGSYKAFRERVAQWSRVSIEAVLRARVG
jgi:TRAP-type mannitol/chloroaromatic compound transport system substrate-binding protein